MVGLKLKVRNKYIAIYEVKTFYRGSISKNLLFCPHQVYKREDGKAFLIRYKKNGYLSSPTRPVCHLINEIMTEFIPDKDIFNESLFSSIADHVEFLSNMFIQFSWKMFELYEDEYFPTLTEEAFYKAAMNYSLDNMPPDLDVVFTILAKIVTRRQNRNMRKMTYKKVSLLDL